MVTQWMPPNAAGELVRDVALAHAATLARNGEYEAAVEIGENDRGPTISLVIDGNFMRRGEISTQVTPGESVLMITLGEDGHRLAGGLRETSLDKIEVEAALNELIALVLAQADL